jgi:uncharacterized LabA/DUF88 family protein
MARVSIYIDGFNVYHAIDKHQNYHKYKWLNYHDLAHRYMGGHDTLVCVKYFTAYAPWDAHKQARHMEYVRALESVGVNVILGKFKKKTPKCRKCGQHYNTHEEKLTDVNIAIHMVNDAQNDRFDHAVIVSGDTDIVPAIEMVKNLFPEKEVHAVIPIGRKSEEMKNACHFNYKMSEAQLAACQFPPTVTCADGTIVSRPATWG